MSYFEEDNPIVYTIENIKILDINQGELLYIKKGDRLQRTSFFMLELLVYPSPESLVELRDWWERHKNDIKTDIEIFVHDFIQKHFDAPQPHVVVLEVKPDFSKGWVRDLSHVKCIAKVFEFEHF